MGRPRVSSVRNLLEEYLGDLRDIAILVQYKLWHFWHLLIYTKPGLIVFNYHPPLLILGLVCLFSFLKSKKIFFGCISCHSRIHKELLTYLYLIKLDKKIIKEVQKCTFFWFQNSYVYSMPKKIAIRVQSFTSMIPDLCQDINSSFY